jgi:Na+/H+-dicarboxylate symporter
MTAASKGEAARDGHANQSRSPVPNILKSLFFQVVIALVLGILIGMAWPDLAVQAKPLGDGFI